MLKIYESRPVGLKCPYCGIKNIKRAAGLENGANLIICDPAEGGCDRYFFAKVSTKVVIDEIQPIGSSFNTCRNCIHWDETQTHTGKVPRPIGECSGQFYGVEGLKTHADHNCAKWEPSE